MAKQPGLYAWWADEERRDALAAQLLTSLPALIYAGHAGATQWPSGKESTTTLLDRVCGRHLQGHIDESTFRRALAAILAEPLALQVIGPDRLAPQSEQRLSAWMADHLRVATCPYSDRDALGAIEHAVLAQLDPPLNLEGMVLSPGRRRVKELRRRLARPE